MPNDHRGEVDCPVGERVVRLKLTLDGVRRAERERGCGWQEIVGRAIGHALYIDDVACLFRIAAECAGDPIVVGKAGAPDAKASAAEVERMIDQHGIAGIGTAVRTAVMLQSIGARAASEATGRGAGGGEASTGSG